MNQTSLYVYGAVGHGRDVADTAELSGQYDVLGLL